MVIDIVMERKRTPASSEASDQDNLSDTKRNFPMPYRIRENICTRCGQCLEECPMGAIEDTADGYTIDPDLCTECGSCADICPAGAITGAASSDEYPDDY